MYRSSPIRSSWGRSTAAATPRSAEALSKLDQAELASRFQAGETVEVVADGETYAVTPEDVEVRLHRAGYSVAEAGGYLVAVTTELDAALSRKATRELVRRIQQLRKDANLEISDRIVTYVLDSDLVHEVLAHFGNYVREETLTVDLVQVHPDQGDAIPAHLPQAGFELGGKEIVIAVSKK